MTMAPEFFKTSFHCLTGYSPMRWQQRLFERFITGDIPQAIDLPTGLGKTSVMAIWLIARSLAGEDVRKAIPRRLVYVVDRRAVVDQATEEAEKLRNALEKGAAHLKATLGLDKAALPISTLRGAYVDNREWLEDPTVPAIIVGTVDMIGSRLLFEGYGVSRKMRPYHAGLLGADTLVVLDEAHLVPPFEALLAHIANGTDEFGPCDNGNAKCVPPFLLLSLSATGRAQPLSNGNAAQSTFSLEEDDLADGIVHERLSAKKLLRCIAIDDKKDALAEELAKRAWDLSKNGKLPIRCLPIRCLVYSDSRAVAETVKAKLDKLSEPEGKGAERKADVELFVGARRIREREHAKAWLQRHGFLAGSQPPVRPAFLVATSAGEVGIDLDADHMVCDLVPWERMVQRLGRVNRRGNGDAQIVVVHGAEPKPKKPEAPTEQEIRARVSYRALAVLQELPAREGGRCASPEAIRELKLRAEADEALRKKIEEATTPEPLRPKLTRALVDAWAMTSLEQHPGRPAIAPWLRGWVEEDPQTTVIWRTHMPVCAGVAGWPRTSAERNEITTFFEAAPPHESEMLETETYRVAEWLHHRANVILKRKSPDAPALAAKGEAQSVDSESATSASLQHVEKLREDDIVALILSPSAEYKDHLTLKDIAEERKGEALQKFLEKLSQKIVVLDARFGGLKDGMLDSESDDLFPTADTDEAWSKEVEFRVRHTTAEETLSEEDDWGFENNFVVKRDTEGEPIEWLIVEHYQNIAQSEDARSVSHPQELLAHQNLVEQKARLIAARIGLSGHAAEALAVAALLHDEGKRASRWQRAFNAERDARTFGLSVPLAKTRGPINHAILDGYRHEFGALPFAEAHARFQALPEEWRALVLHLIAAHHGQARPVIETRGCEDAPPSALEARARDVALRFARLQKRWGPWGLAWWEALLRAADQQASRENDRHASLRPVRSEKN